MHKLMLFLAFILSIPAVIIGAFVFEDIGGQLLISWFSLVLGLIGIGGILRFRQEQLFTYELVEGTVVSLHENTRYSDEPEHFRDLQVFINPVIEYFWRGQRYTCGALMNYNEHAYNRFGPKIGDKLSLSVPIQHPEAAIEHKFLARYSHLIIGVMALFISVVLAALLLTDVVAFTHV
ncbi:hypothetical protein [Shewanella mangrovisoli]|uniref:hypothetical protein n=1 Tax=Shewanella mangrovisoli TaxID=2864211 RepID=UPI00003247E4